MITNCNIENEIKNYKYFANNNIYLNIFYYIKNKLLKFKYLLLKFIWNRIKYFIRRFILEIFSPYFIYLFEIIKPYLIFILLNIEPSINIIKEQIKIITDLINKFTNLFIKTVQDIINKITNWFIEIFNISPYLDSIQEKFKIFIDILNSYIYLFIERFNNIYLDSIHPLIKFLTSIFNQIINLLIEISNIFPALPELLNFNLFIGLFSFSILILSNFKLNLSIYNIFKDKFKLNLSTYGGFKNKIYYSGFANIVAANQSKEESKLNSLWRTQKSSLLEHFDKCDLNIFKSLKFDTELFLDMDLIYIRNINFNFNNKDAYIKAINNDPIVDDNSPLSEYFYHVRKNVLKSLVFLVDRRLTLINVNTDDWTEKDKNKLRSSILKIEQSV
uniref:Transient receptor potential cation channel subfamily M member 7 n=1 Tax=Dactylellina haptotyla TaxID=430498 RepID=A0A481ZJP8_9PEZI|nr:transient receptor potential cation channel subfamily M member 7 [Dactylellina haptotyla]QBL01984.1 transient receptor potential cation channel subfamily M member 7 [Dactylellina haptotyla]